MDVVYLVYGLAFLAMGLVIVVRHASESALEISGIIWLLAGFAFTHGLLEWTDLWRVVRGDTPTLEAIRPGLLLVSYLFLFEFGRRLLRLSLGSQARGGWVQALTGGWVHAPLLGILAVATLAAESAPLTATILSRYLYGFTGSLLTGVAFHLHWRHHLAQRVSAKDLPGIRLGSGLAAASFIAYAILGGLVVPKAAWFPALLLNQENFLATFGFPVQLARACCAVLVAVSMAILLRIFRLESLHLLEDAALATQRALAELRVVSHQNELILRYTADGIFGVDMGGNTLFVNDAALAMLGFTREQLIGRSIHDLTHHTTTSGKPHPISDCAIHLTLRDHTPRRMGDDVFWRADGSAFPVEYISAPLWDGGIQLGAVVAFHDISEHKRAEEELRIAATAFEAQEGMVITDARGVIQRVNRAFTDITGYTPEEAIGRTPALLKSGHHDHAFYAGMWNTLADSGIWQGEIWNRRKNGEVYPEWLTITAVKDATGEVTHYVATMSDISRRKEAEDEIRHLAFYDPLTHLPNRRLLADRINHARLASARSGHHGTLLFIDLDNFKTLNDTLGHDKGDALLEQVAHRLKESVRESDTVARFGGDEFVVLLENLGQNPEDAVLQTRLIGEKILTVLHHPFLIAEHSYHTSSSIGATLFAGQKASVEELLKQADLAMYQSKEAGRNTMRFFDHHMQAMASARATMESDLRLALERGEFLLYYQPQVDGQGRTTGAEALLRWRHPKRGLVPPTEFIPLAEENGLILPMGRWVLETACDQLVAWSGDPATRHLTVAVNISARQFRHPDFAREVLDILQRTGANPRRLKLELTESLLLDDLEDVIAKMSQLKIHGVGFALDDFGTGYSSLSYLKRLPLDQLKIDQSFVRDVLNDPNDATIARTIITLARSLDLAVIAEGVETRAQRDFLAGEGCHAFQGYLFGRPEPVLEPGPEIALQA